MPPKISVVAHVGSYNAALVELIRSIDAQSLSYRDFEVIFLVPEVATTARGRLEELARHRPNVEVQPFDGSWSDALVSASGGVTAPSVLPLSPHVQDGGVRLHPEALQRLSDFLEDYQCDLAAVRASWPNKDHFIPAVFRRDLAQIEQSQIMTVLSGSTLGYRSEFVRRTGLLLDAPSVERISAATERIGILGSHPILAYLRQSQDRATNSGGSGGIVSSQTIAGMSAAWRDGRVRLATGAAADQSMVVQLSVLDRSSGAEYWLPARTGETTEWEIDVRSAAAGSPLADGQWTVMINAYGQSDKPVLRSPFPAAPMPAGFVDGKLIVPTEIDGALVVDVGATKVPPVSKLELDQVQITEDARGALLTARIPRIQAVGNSVVDGAVILDRLKLPARLFIDDGEGARIECFVSGLAGEHAIATQFGRSPAAQSGLSLVISAVGELSVREAPIKPQKAKVTSESQSALSRIRHSVPPPLEPIAQRLSRNQHLRRLYRKLT